MSLTPGLVKAISRGGTRVVCPCGFPLPRYPGRYPSKCPQCGRPIGGAAAPADAGDDETPSAVVPPPDGGVED